MSDSEASSDPEDAEYFPEGDAGFSESEESGGDDEEWRGAVKAAGKGRKKPQRKQPQRKQPSRQPQRKQPPRGSHRTRRSRGGVKLGARGRRQPSDDDSEDSEKEEEEEEVEEEEEEEEEQNEEEKEEGREIQERAKVDDLWTAFKQDVGSKVGQSQGVVSSPSSKAEAEPKTVKIKKTYDFAGEEVTVEEEVAAGSKEAQHFSQGPVSSTSSPPPLPSSSETAATDAGKPSAVSPAARSILAGSKRSSGVGSVLQSLSKKPKMSTLEKSKLDWEHFKEEEGLEHELSQRRKDGYLERQEFLQRSDLRQFELEREERLKRFKRPL